MPNNNCDDIHVITSIHHLSKTRLVEPLKNHGTPQKTQNSQHHSFSLCLHQPHDCKTMHDQPRCGEDLLHLSDFQNPLSSTKFTALSMLLPFLKENTRLSLLWGSHFHMGSIQISMWSSVLHKAFLLMVILEHHWNHHTTCVGKPLFHPSNPSGPLLKVKPNIFSRIQCI